MRKYTDAAQLLRWERALKASTVNAYRLWLPAVRTAVLPSLQAASDFAELPPDPAAITGTQTAWEQALASTMLTDLDGLMQYRIADLLDDLVVAGTVDLSDTPVIEETRTAYLLAVSNRMVNTPTDVFREIAADLAKGAEQGEGISELRRRTRGHLSLDDEGGFEQWMTRAERVARTETTGAFNGSAHIAATHREAVTGTKLEKVWVATMDPRTRKEHFAADGQRRALTGRFKIGRSELRYPGDPSGRAGDVINCRCTTMEVEAGDDVPDTADRQTERERSDGSTRDPSAEVERRKQDGVIRARDDEANDGSVQAAAGSATTMGKRLTWAGNLAPLGAPTGDGRIFDPSGTFNFRTFPLPLQWAREANYGHEGAVVVGSIREASVGSGVIPASGVLFDPAVVPEAAELAELVREGVVRPSVDICDDVWDVVDEAGNPVDEQALMDAWDRGEDPVLLMRVLSCTIMAATIVSTPAFAEAVVTITGEEVDDGARAGDATAPDPAATPDPATTDPAAPDTPAPTDPATPDPATPAPAARVDNEVALVAAAAVATRWRPPAASFADPQFVAPTALHVTPEGRVQGHLATWGVCHVGIQQECITAPHTRTEYAYFHVGEVQTDKGQALPVGHLTIGGGHADPRFGVTAATHHYDDTGTTWAAVRAGEDAHGIWVSGVVDPQATPEQVAKGLRHPLSGDWRRVAGNLELVAALGVVSGGFPVPRGARGSRGEDLSLVAAGALPITRPAPKVTPGGGQTMSVVIAQAAKAAVAEMRASDARAVRASRLRASVGTDPRSRADALRDRLAR